MRWRNIEQRKKEREGRKGGGEGEKGIDRQAQ